MPVNTTALHYSYLLFKTIISITTLCTLIDSVRVSVHVALSMAYQPVLSERTAALIRTFDLPPPKPMPIPLDYWDRYINLHVFQPTSTVDFQAERYLTYALLMYCSKNASYFILEEAGFGCVYFLASYTSISIELNWK